MKNPGYSKLAFKGWTGVVHEAVPALELEGIVPESGEMHHNSELLQPVKADRKSRVFLSFMTFSGHSSRVYIKQFSLHSLFALIKYDLGQSRARSAFNASLMLAQFGVNAQKPLVLMEKKIGPVTRSSILITQEVPEGVQLSERLKQLSQDGSVNALRRKRHLIREFGKMVGEMHHQGILHGDLRLRNVLVQDKGENFCFWFIDNERTNFFSRLSPGQVQKHMVQMNKWKMATNADRLRFIKAYADKRRFSREELKTLVERIYKRIGVRRIIKRLHRAIRVGRKRAVLS